MNYREAIRLLEETRQHFTYNNEKYTAVITPAIIEDRTRFLVDLKLKKINPADVRNYSNDNNYVIDALMNKAFNL